MPADLELVIMKGIQGAGKSTWVSARYATSHAVVSKDHWPNARKRQARQSRLVAECLAGGRSVVVDNTNASAAIRAPLVALGRDLGARVVAVWVDTPVAVAWARNARRDERAMVPDVGLRATLKEFEPPSSGEGFDQIVIVRGDDGDAPGGDGSAAAGL